MTATDARIVGFVGEPSPGLLTCHRPVIEVEGHRYAALREDWAFADDDLSQLTDQTRRYVRLGIDNEDPAKPGALVWLVGSLFISTLGLGTVALKEPYGDFGGWQKYKGGFSYWTGSKHEFVQLQRRVYDDLKLSLHAALFDSYAVKSETCKALFSAFATLPPPPDDPADHLLLEALYRWRVWDWDRFGLVKQFAVDEGYFADAESFDNRFEDYKKWLSEPRPDETGVAQPRRILADSRPAQVRGLFRLDLPGRVYRGAGTSTPRQVSPRPTDVEVALQSLLESLNETHKTLTSSYSVVSDYAWDWMVRSTTNENKVES